MPIAKDVNLEKLADISHGFVGADLQALSKEAAMRALRRVLPEIDLSSESISGDILMKIIVTMQDFTEVINEMEPSAMREVFVEVPNVTWEDIGGLSSIKQELQEAVEWPLKYQGVFAHVDATHRREYCFTVRREQERLLWRKQLRTKVKPTLLASRVQSFFQSRSVNLKKG
jgi:transitional endoplasmic reticulum ATPase